MCSDTNTVPNESPEGQYCWCKATGFISNDGQTQNISTTSWTYATFKENCTLDCVGFCAGVTRTGSAFRTKLYNDKNTCAPIVYNINYHNVNDTDWVAPANHPATYTINSGDVAIGTPVRSGYTFNGWCDGSDNCANPINPFEFNASNRFEDIDLYAQWTPTIYTITYNSNGGTEFDDDTYTIESDTITLPTPTRDKYDFEGWYEAADFSGTSVNQIVSGSLGNKIFYAKWTPKAFVCDSGVWLHIGADKACLSETKIGSPVMKFDIGGNYYYLQMTKNKTLKLNENATKKMRIHYKNADYNVHDTSVTIE